MRWSGQDVYLVVPQGDGTVDAVRLVVTEVTWDRRGPSPEEILLHGYIVNERTYVPADEQWSNSDDRELAADHPVLPRQPIELGPGSRD